MLAGERGTGWGRGFRFRCRHYFCVINRATLQWARSLAVEKFTGHTAYASVCRAGGPPASPENRVVPSFNPLFLYFLLFYAGLPRAAAFKRRRYHVAFFGDGSTDFLRSMFACSAVVAAVAGASVKARRTSACVDGLEHRVGEEKKKGIQRSKWCGHKRAHADVKSNGTEKGFGKGEKGPRY